MTRSLKSLSRLIALPVGLAGAVYALGNALSTHDWIMLAGLVPLVVVGILLLTPSHTEPAK